MPVRWEDLPDESLLECRVCDLGLTIEGTVLEERIRWLYEELLSRSIQFHPSCYLADEWLCPDRVPIIGIPFYLAHPRLTELERTMMLEAEGDTEQWCMRLLRHEAGHALNYAYRLYRRTQWREHFGRFTERYTSNYAVRPYSRRYVQHLEDNYAQAHPDEDFAETFAVWLDPGSNWATRYRGWPALRKLQYVERLMTALGDTIPVVATVQTPWAAARMRSTLAAYYERKRRMLGDDFPGYYDPALQRLFIRHDHSRGQGTIAADRLLGRHRRRIVATVASWTGHRRFDVDRLVRRLAGRARALKLGAPRDDVDTLISVAALVSAIMAGVRRKSRGKVER